MKSFLPLKKNSVTIGFSCLLALISTIISSNIIKTFLSLSDYSLLNSHKHQLFVSNE